MSKIAIVTDSSAYLPEDLIKNAPVFTIPLLLLWGERSQRDGVDIKPEAFYHEMKVSKINPTTSQPAPSDFITIYKKLLEEGYDIFSIHISSTLSGTLDSALQAKKALASERISVVDSCTTSMAMGFQILAVLKAIQNGADLRKCEEIAENAKKHTGLYFVVSDLEYLRRGGRIGGAAAFLGTVLNLKPILTVRDGKIDAVEKVRTMNKAIDRMLELVEQDVAKMGSPVKIACLYSDNPADAKKMAEHIKRLHAKYPVEETFNAALSPVIGSHVGPGTMGLCYVAGL